MARFTGTTLKVARFLTGVWPVQAIAGRRMRESYDVDEWDALPAAARDGFESNDEPVPGAAPRDWGDEEYDPPETRAGGAAVWRRGFRDGDVTPVDALQFVRERLDDRDLGNVRHTPFAAHDWDRAIEQAAASTDRWEKGEPLSPLDGVPVPIKDHHRQLNLPTTNGTSYFADWNGADEADSEVVRRLAEAGAVLLGKSITTEWGVQPTGFSPHFEMPRNAYDDERAAGGSSTGTGAAVALGLSPVGLGSDGGGSIRIPSTVNGLVGLKPTYQRLSRVGDYWQWSTMGHNGPIGRCTADLVDFLEVTAANPDEDDPATIPPREIDGAPATDTEDWRKALGRGIEGARIGVWSWAMESADPDIRRPVRGAIDTLEQAGAQIDTVDIAFGEHHRGIGTINFGAEFLGLLAETIGRFPALTGDDVRLVYNVFESITLEEYMEARRMRAVLRKNLAETISEVDLLAMPTTGMPAPVYPAEQTGQAVYDETAIDRLCQYTFLTNLTGLPAGTVPCGRVNGLPIGLQFVGDAWDEASVLAAMAHCERIGITDIPEPGCFEDIVERL